MTVLSPRFRPELAGVLAKAEKAYRGRDDAAFRLLLAEAAELAPERIDLRGCLASHHIQTGRPEAAVAVYEDILRLVPGDADALLRLAHWRRHMGDGGGAAALRLELRRIHPARAAELSRIWNILDAWFARPVRDAVPSFSAAVRRPAIIVLGHALADDGTPRAELVRRLEKAGEAAGRHPGALIIASGGVPRAGRAEATAMREWLEAAGVQSARIAEEGYSRDVVENLVYSRVIAALNGVDAILVVTSAVDVRRAGASLEIMAGICGDRWPVQAAAALADGFPDDGADRLKAYRDALRSAGMPMLAAYPGLAER